MPADPLRDLAGRIALIEAEVVHRHQRRMDREATDRRLTVLLACDCALCTGYRARQPAPKRRP